MKTSAALLGSFKVPVKISLSEEQVREALRLINLHYLGDELCNRYEGREIVPKYPEKETKEFKDAVHACRMTHIETLEFLLDSNGNLHIA